MRLAHFVLFNPHLRLAKLKRLLLVPRSLSALRKTMWPLVQSAR
jgi:hypothetical protein